MKLTKTILTTALILILMSFSAHASDSAATSEKPAKHEVIFLSLEATVDSIDREKRQIVLKNAQGETTTIALDEEAGKLDTIDKGDQVTINYIESVSIEVFGPDELKAGAAVAAVAAASHPEEKPEAVVAGQVVVVVTIVDIDLENELATIKYEDGQVKTIKPQHPENLKKVKVGDMVKITYTQVIGFSVTEKPVVKH